VTELSSSNEYWVPVSKLIDNGIYSKSYVVSNLGRIRGPRKVLTGKVDKDGYRVVILSAGKYRKSIAVHRVVALTFITNIHNSLTVNHINCDKTDNRVKNLEWVSSLTNSRHGAINGLMPSLTKPHLDKIRTISKSRIGFDSPVGKEISIHGITYGSISVASKILKISETTIRRWIESHEDVFLHGKEVVAIVAGSFNPITISHIKLITELKRRNYVDKVFVIPSYIHLQKNTNISYQHRVNMCVGALEHYNKCDVLDIEPSIPNFDGSYIMLAEYLSETYPNYIFKHVIGQDCAENINTWKNSDKLLRDYSFIVIPRDDIETRHKWYMKKPHRFLNKIETPNISSTLVRNHSDIAKCDFIDASVKKYILTNDLYGDLDG